MRVALATCMRKPEPDPDEALLVEALARAGLQPSVLAWDDPDAPWHTMRLCVLRSTWNYYVRPADFLAWAERTAAATRLLNPLPIVRWNAHKGYLRELAARGVPVIDTVHVPRGGAPDLAALLEARAWSCVVVKPAVSAASFATFKVDLADARAAQETLAAAVAAREMMVQPYLRSVEGHGERSLMWLDGALTHAIRKAPRFAGEHEHASPTVEIADDERRVAEAALAPFTDELLYARVDLARDDAGAPRVMELELIEPSLFLAQHPPALARLAAAIARRAAQ